MTELRLRGSVVHTVFDLLGSREDDITYSLGWALSQSDRLVAALMAEVFDTDPGAPAAIGLQHSIHEAGRTDVEIETERAHLIVEAKVRWDLPDHGQLSQYAGRFSADKALAKTILVVSECSAEWALPRLPDHIDAIPVRYLPWSRIAALVEQTAIRSRSSAEKRLLHEFVRYLKGLMTMQDVTSNLVFVVPLSLDELVDDGTGWTDIVTEHGRYFHPFAGNWPKTPPNYLGFRFWGAVQQIRHVESSELSDAPWEEIPGLKGKLDWDPSPHVFYTLGPAIVPPIPPRTDGLYGPGHHWSALDLLLTCDSLRVARDKTQERLDAAGE